MGALVLLLAPPLCGSGVHQRSCGLAAGMYLGLTIGLTVGVTIGVTIGVVRGERCCATPFHVGVEKTCGSPRGVLASGSGVAGVAAAVGNPKLGGLLQAGEGTAPGAAG